MEVGLLLRELPGPLPRAVVSTGLQSSSPARAYARQLNMGCVSKQLNPHGAPNWRKERDVLPLPSIQRGAVCRAGLSAKVRKRGVKKWTENGRLNESVDALNAWHNNSPVETYGPQKR